jgi:hypothetical protein
VLLVMQESLNEEVKNEENEDFEMNDPETLRLKEEEFLDRFKLIEKFLLFWLPKSDK